MPSQHTPNTDLPLPPAGVTDQYRAEWMNARRRDEATR